VGSPLRGPTWRHLPTARQSVRAGHSSQPVPEPRPQEPLGTAKVGLRSHPSPDSLREQAPGVHAGPRRTGRTQAAQTVQSAALAMYPILFTLRLSAASVPLAVAWGSLALFGLLLAAVGFKRNQRLPLGLGACLAASAAVGGYSGQGLWIALGDFSATSFGVALAIAVASGYVVMAGLERVHLRSRNRLTRASLAAVVSGIVGARLQFALETHHQLSSPWESFALLRGGLTGYGGIVIGAAAGLFLLRDDARIRALWADAAAIACALGIAVTRLGCYLFGCDFGTPLASDAPGWLRIAGTFPRWEGTLAKMGAPAWVEHVTSRGLPESSPFSLAVHQTQLYEALAALGILSVLLWRRSRQRHLGELLLWFMVGYACVRLVVDVYRDDPERLLLGTPMNAAWFVACAVLLMALPLRLRWRQSPWASRLGRWQWMLAAALVGLVGLLLSRYAGRAPSITPSLTQWLSLTLGLTCGLFWQRWTSLVGSAQKSFSNPRA